MPDDADVVMSDEQRPPTTIESQQENNNTVPSSLADAQAPIQDQPAAPKVIISQDESVEGKANDLNKLYPMFWGLQAYFSAPTRIFDPQHFTTFRTGLEATLSAFKSVNTDLESSGTGKTSEELRKSSKRKRTADGQEIASSFNPKYLTSRDLFDLEVGSLSGFLSVACANSYM